RAYPAALTPALTPGLVSQIHSEARKFAYRSRDKPAIMQGGADINLQLCQLEREADILSVSPGRLVDLIERGRISRRSIRYLDLDEAHRILDVGSEPQIRRTVQGEGHARRPKASDSHAQDHLPPRNSDVGEGLVEGLCLSLRGPCSLNFRKYYS
ncbi:hypothetical protein BS47DRAFT_1449935, partial [Hydnum rufescens UP504]